MRVGAAGGTMNCLAASQGRACVAMDLVEHGHVLDRRNYFEATG